jgi:predicted dehydrogenase
MSKRIGMAVIGAGRMGGFHAKACAENPDVELVAVVDQDLGRAAKIAAEHGTAASATIDEFLGKIKAAVVAVPTVAHLAVAGPLLERGVACLVEKPLAATSAEAGELVAMARRGRAILQVGHTERFNPVFTALGRYDLKPRFIETERLSPCRFRSMDVGVVMDMMIHDLDLVLSLVRSEAVSVDAVGVALVGVTEDMANARVRFANGCVADFAASRTALKVERRMRIFAENAYVTADFNTRQAVVIRPNERLAKVRAAALERGRFDEAAVTGAQFQDLLDIQPIVIDEHDALRQQLASFLRAVRGEGPVVVTGDDGRRAVELAERIVAGIEHTSK